MIHLRIVAPSYQSEHALDLLKATPSAVNLIYLPGAAQKPEGDVILVDVAREEASVIISDLRELNIDKEGSIAVEEIDAEMSDAAARAEKSASGPLPTPSSGSRWRCAPPRTSRWGRTSSRSWCWPA